MSWPFYKCGSFCCSFYWNKYADYVCKPDLLVVPTSAPSSPNSSSSPNGNIITRGLSANLKSAIVRLLCEFVQIEWSNMPYVCDKNARKNQISSAIPNFLAWKISLSCCCFFYFLKFLRYNTNKHPAYITSLQLHLLTTAYSLYKVLDILLTSTYNTYHNLFLHKYKL